jgi:3-oxoacyl-[acyl-carrier-protein] synthase-3
MANLRAKIVGVGSAVPDKVVKNDDLAKVIETSDDWITTRTGIKERRVSEYNEATSDFAFKAAKDALSAAKIPAEDMDLILVATCSPDTLFPSTACILQDKLNAKKAAAFDLSAACSGFNFALSVASSYISSGTYSNILVVGADTLTKYVDWKDRTTCVLFGDGAGAVVLKPSSDGTGILSSYLMSHGSKGKYLVMPGGGSRDPECRNSRFIQMDGKEVFKFAVKALEDALLHALQLANLKISDVDLLIPHQANIRIIDHAIKKLGLPREKVYVNLERYGNTSAASIPLALSEAMKASLVRPGNIVALAGFGAGLTAGANIIKW